MKKRLFLATILLCGALDAMRAATPESLDPLSFDTASGFQGDRPAHQLFQLILTSHL